MRKHRTRNLEIPRCAICTSEVWACGPSRNHRELDFFATSLRRNTPLRTLHKRGKRLGIIWMPARERGTIFDDVAHGPEHPPLVETPRRLVVRAQDVEI